MNTDYKLLMFILTLSLRQVLPFIIGEEQNGFLPGRFLTNNFMQYLLIDECEKNQVIRERGLIMFLDQEKAYEKFGHSFLWKVLETIKFDQE